MCDCATKYCADQLWVNSSTIDPTTIPESPGLMPISDSEWTVSSGGTKPGKVDPSPSCREGSLIRWLLSFQSCISNHIDWMTGGQLFKWHGRSYQSVHSWHRLKTSTRRYILLPWVYSKGLWWCKPHWLSFHWWTLQPYCSLKGNAMADTNIQKTVADSNKKNENSPQEDLWHNWHNPEKALGTEVAAAA